MEGSVSFVFLIPLVGNLALLFVLWVVYNVRDQKLVKSPGEGKVYRCEACSCVYLGPQDLPGANCHRCGHYNDAVRR